MDEIVVAVELTRLLVQTKTARTIARSQGHFSLEHSMRFWVRCFDPENPDVEMPIREPEFQEYIAVLQSLGVDVNRDEQGRIGIVDDLALAQQIRDEMERRVNWLIWRVREVE